MLLTSQFTRLTINWFQQAFWKTQFRGFQGPSSEVNWRLCLVPPHLNSWSSSFICFTCWFSWKKGFYGCENFRAPVFEERCVLAWIFSILIISVENFNNMHRKSGQQTFFCKGSNSKILGTMGLTALSLSKQLNRLNNGIIAQEQLINCVSKWAWLFQ